MSPPVDPMRISLTSGEGGVRDPSNMRSHVVGDWLNAARGEGVGLFLNLGNAVGGLAVEIVVSLEGICPNLSHARSSMSLTVCGGS